VQEAAYDQAKQVCTEGGYGEGSPYYSYCMQHLTPSAAQLEQQRRNALIQSGVANIADGIQPNPTYAQPSVPQIVMPEPTPPVAHRPTWCMQSVVGGQIVCQ
jgi:hypothetical protein